VSARPTCVAGLNDAHRGTSVGGSKLMRFSSRARFICSFVGATCAICMISENCAREHERASCYTSCDGDADEASGIGMASHPFPSSSLTSTVSLATFINSFLTTVRFFSGCTEMTCHNTRDAHRH
jgi:hypothetical protein